MRPIPRFVTALAACALAVSSAQSSSAAPADPDLLVLDASVTVLGVQLDVIDTELTIHLAHHEANEPLIVQAQNGLKEARRRDFERILLECALHPERCIPPMVLSSAVATDCTPNPNDDHGIGYDCTIQEILDTVGMAITAVRNQALPRDADLADALLAAADAAKQAGDGREAFDQACAAYKVIACP